MPGASPSREQGGPLSLIARLGLYAMLAGLVLASFTVNPERRAPEPEPATPTDATYAMMRAELLSRGVARRLRDAEDLTALPSPTPTAEPTLEPVAVPMRFEPLPEEPTTPVPEPTAEVTPRPTPKPTPTPTPVPTPAATPPPAPPPAGPVTSPTLWAEVRMLELMNASRAQAGLVPLVMDVTVANTARAHSAAEAQVRYVYHDGPDGTAKSRNVPACGSGWYGENTGKIWKDNIDVLHNEFMAEPWAPINHRTNIMDPAFRRVGVGAVYGPDAMYMTVVFCR